MFAVVVLLALVVVRVLVMGALAYALLPADRRCPACGAETVALQRAGLARAAPGLVRRWCVACGWSWYRRRMPAVPPVATNAAGRPVPLGHPRS